MKKKTLLSLVMAGVISATMLPMSVMASFSPDTTDTATVTYRYGSGTIGPNNSIRYYVPKNLTLPDDLITGSKFKIYVEVWNPNGGTDKNGDWEFPAATGGTSMGGTVEVQVQSKNGYKLFKTTDTKQTGANATYTIDGKNGAKDTYQLLYKLEDEDTKQTSASSLTKAGKESTLLLTERPKDLGQTGSDEYTDVLTFGFKYAANSVG